MNGVFGLFILVLLVGIVRAEESECQQGEIKISHCSTCACHHGVFICTKIVDCYLNPIAKRQVPQIEEEPECMTGDIKQERCNPCTCVNGMWACTDLACNRKREAIAYPFTQTSNRLKRETPIAADLKNTPCAPNDYFQIDCNTCYCNIDRSGYLCTENICHDPPIDSSTTSQIPLSNDTMLIISDRGVRLLEKFNSNDNNLSRISKSLKNPTENSIQSTASPVNARNFTKISN